MQAPLVVDPVKDVFICHREDEPYMHEYLNYIKGEGSVVLYGAGTPAFADREKRYICIRRVPFELLPPETDVPVVFVNTEQLSVPRKMVEYRAYTASPRVGAVYDYSTENIKLSNGRSGHLPLRERAVETELLKKYMRQEGVENADKIACIGTPTQYRIDAINALRRRGVGVDFIQAFGEERDRRVASCKILLNLHAGPSYRLYEALRCERWRFAGMPIVSEACTDAVPAGIHVMPISEDFDVAAAALKKFVADLPS